MWGWFPAVASVAHGRTLVREGGRWGVIGWPPSYRPRGVGFGDTGPGFSCAPVELVGPYGGGLRGLLLESEVAPADGAYWGPVRGLLVFGALFVLPVGPYGVVKLGPFCPDDHLYVALADEGDEGSSDVLFAA